MEKKRKIGWVLLIIFCLFWGTLFVKYYPEEEKEREIRSKLIGEHFESDVPWWHVLKVNMSNIILANPSEEYPFHYYLCTSDPRVYETAISPLIHYTIFNYIHQYVKDEQYFLHKENAFKLTLEEIERLKSISQDTFYLLIIDDTYDAEKYEQSLVELNKKLEE